MLTRTLRSGMRTARMIVSNRSANPALRFAAVMLATLAVVVMSACSGTVIPEAGTSAELESALAAAGLNVVGPSDNNPLDARIFSLPGSHYTANGEKVLVYEFGSVEEAASEAAEIAPDGYGIGSKYVGWGGTPHVHVSGRLIVVYVGDTIKIKDALAASMGEQIAGEL